MIRATFTSKGNLFQNLQAYLESFQQSVNQTHAAVVQELEPTIQDELSYTPPDPPWSLDNPLPWTSDQQRKAFHASQGFGGGIPHTRSSPGIPDGWIVTNDGQGHTVIANPSPGALYLYGSLAKTNPGLHQQMFLILGGWPQGYAMVKFWSDAIFEEVARRIDEQFKGMGSVNFSSRAYSRR